MINHSRIFLLFILFVGISAGCGSGDSSELTNSVRDEAEINNGTAIVSIAIKNGDIRLWPGESSQLSVIGTDMNNDTRDVSNEVSWHSSDTTIATINSSGLVEASLNNQGSIEVEARYRETLSIRSEILVDEVEISELFISFAEPEQSMAYTCIDSQLIATAMYVDGFQEDISSRASWGIPATSNAKISSGGLFTSSDPLKTTETIQLSYHNSNVTTDISIKTDAIQAINIIQENNSSDSLSLNIGEATTLKAMASLKASLSDEIYNVSAAGNWDTANNLIAVINNTEEQIGYIHGLSSGTTALNFSCGHALSSNIVSVTGNSSILKLQINDDETTATIDSGEILEIQLWLLYSDDRDNFNLTDYANWTLSNDELVDFVALDSGTEASKYSLFPQTGKTGNLILNAYFAETAYTLVINISE